MGQSAFRYFSELGLNGESYRNIDERKILT
jgi:hypothetical protein